VAISLYVQTGLGLGRSVLNSLFGVVTAFSTTGYGTMDYYTWPPFALGIFFMLMFIGGCVWADRDMYLFSGHFFVCPNWAWPWTQRP